MKKFILAVAAVSMVATPVLAAPAQQRHQTVTKTVVKHKPNGRTVVKQTVRRPAPQYRTSWRKGERFDYRQARNYRQVDYRSYHGRLKAPPRGYRYVQSGNDAVLVGITSGLIAAVFANVLR
ncbi:RcnB family protein [Sphingomonas sp. HF-S3]|jgi:Ni/Co efflux regulator RcnB|uniref:RcnB family protein n=1 Tax=Sphingomonas rustica TaxID=3103142 RepID=A0ABV0B803_9SPHN